MTGQKPTPAFTPTELLVVRIVAARVRCHVAFGVFLVALLSLPATGKEWYLAPTGHAGAAGTMADPLDLGSVLAGTSAVGPGDTAWLLEAVYPGPESGGRRTAFVSYLSGTPAEPIILRGEPGKRVTLDGWMEIRGHDAWYWGFEVADSRFVDRTEAGASLSGTGVNVLAPRSKFINLHVHQATMGFGFWSAAENAEVYGCITNDFGYAGPVRGHGHAVYAQNAVGTKRIADNIMFDGYGWNLHVYTERGQVQGFDIEGNIAFAPGMKIDDDPKDNYLLSAYQPMDRINFVHNVGHHPETGGWRPNARLSTYGPKNGTAAIQGNYLMGLRGLLVEQWNQVTVTGNTVWGPDRVLELTYGPSDAWTVDNNTYIAPAGAGMFDDGMTFSAYQAASGFDAHSTLIDAGRPTTNYVFVRPNQYEPGRGHVAVFDWERLGTVPVDLSAVVPVGWHYRVHNVQDLYGPPVAAGVYGGGSVSLPMLGASIAPEFDAFLVTSVVPEPATFALLLVAGLAALRRRTGGVKRRMPE